VKYIPNSIEFAPGHWPSARQFNEAVQCPAVCFHAPSLRNTLPAVDRLGMPLVTSGQFAYVYKLKSINAGEDFAVRCFRGYLGDRDHRYRAIHTFLRERPIPFLTDFTYASEGILISGKRYPILFMKWLDGPTLDLYVEDMIDRKDVLLHLAQEWLRLVATLKQAGVAHGDLQHGNVIVEHGRLLLVDHDGMFVPEMEGWESCELGHQHYQHPHRNVEHFDANLDNFSALAIYLSLISLAEAPELWRSYHDENLLFSRSDFLNPGNSTLFAKIRSLSEEHNRLADALISAAQGSPAEVPSLVDLVAIQGTLPAWMRTPIDLETETKTREVQLDPRARQEHPRWIPRREQVGQPLPASTASANYQTLFNTNLHKAGVTRDPDAIWTNTLAFSKEFLGKTIIWWYWAAYIVLQIMGFNFLPTLFIAIVSLVAICLLYGYLHARRLFLESQQGRPLIGPNLPPGLVQSQSQINSLKQPVASSVTANDPIIGNMALSIYHKASCNWVSKILNKNRVSFVSVAEATQAGFKPCQVCSRP
jgi:hypothetical protein